MILTAFHGFCMALADSVPGVSGGTIAFILGFYERFLDALHSLFRGTGAERKTGLLYLLKLGIGMAACVVLLSGLFAKNIYFMSSLFLGLTVCSIPFVVSAERKSLGHPLRHGWFLLLGIAVVMGLTLLRTGTGALGSVNYAHLSPLQFGYLFLSGAVAITAMVLPGISGSSILLIAGVYLPHHSSHPQLSAVPVRGGAGAVRSGLRRHRRGRPFHSRHPYRPAEIPGADGLADFGIDAGLPLCHRQWPRQFGHSLAAHRPHHLPVPSLCPGGGHSSGSGIFKKAMERQAQTCSVQKGESLS